MPIFKSILYGIVWLKLATFLTRKFAYKFFLRPSINKNGLKVIFYFNIKNFLIDEKFENKNLLKSVSFFFIPGKLNFCINSVYNNVSDDDFKVNKLNSTERVLHSQKLFLFNCESNKCILNLKNELSEINSRLREFFMVKVFILIYI